MFPWLIAVVGSSTFRSFFALVATIYRVCAANNPERKFGVPRDGRWRTVRKNFLEGKTCEVCQGVECLEVHHVKPFHLHKELELDESNLICLCEKPGHNCHFVFGHLLSWKSSNSNVREDAARQRKKIQERPQDVVA